MTKKFLFTISLSFLLTAALNIFIFESILWVEFLLGNVLSILFHMTGAWIKLKTIGNKAGDFLKYSIGFTFLKDAVFFLFVILILSSGYVSDYHFLTTLFFSYILFLTFNLLNWHWDSLKKREGAAIHAGTV